MSTTKYFQAGPDDAELHTAPKSPPEPAKMALTHHSPDFVKLMKYTVKALDKVTIHNPSRDAPADFDESTQAVPEATLHMASGLTDTEEALNELLKVSVIHTQMIEQLQEANDEVSEQLQMILEKMHRMDADMRALRATQTINSLAKQYLFRADKTATDQQTFTPSPDRYQQSFVNPFVMSPVTTYDRSHWTDMSNNIAATLAVAPQVPDSPSSSSNPQERRPAKPHRYAPRLFPPHMKWTARSKADASAREEHVKRSRVTYDGTGGQTPNMSPTAVVALGDGDSSAKQECFQDNEDTESVYGSVSSGESSLEGDAECDEPEEPSEPSLSSWIYGKATKALFRR